MTGELEYITFNTNMGWIGLVGSAKGLLRTTLPCCSAKEAEKQLGDKAKGAIRSASFFSDLTQCLRSYFSGQKVTFTDSLDLSGATTFQRGVWEATRLIPYGETRSYIWVAEQIEKPKAARAVGQALARNPLPVIVPCHRVLNIDGKLGGFGGGVEMKRLLLSLEASTGSR